ncbi:MAG: ATP phosphoribosyltransferase regulatory subunit [Eubacteriales bacterium]
MIVSDDILTFGERTELSLRSLYKSYGYTQYKMNKFEEYDLYASNKNFLVSDNVITFTDTDGKLMALKPDVTLSIIKNAHPKGTEIEKLFYDENVYRVANGTKTFKEIKQAGLECLGNIDAFCIAEVLNLAAKSLAMISPSYVLEISHAGIISDILDEYGFSEATKNEIIKCMGEKNLHGVFGIFESYGVSPAKIASVMKMNENAEESLAFLKENFPGRATEELANAVQMLCKEVPTEKIRIDFSVVNDMNYYNGIVFRGYVSGVPFGVLSGGQYGSLVRKMGKNYEAIGFAVYLDMLEELEQNDDECDVDVLVIYGDTCDINKLFALCDELRAGGESVTARKNIPDKLRYRRLVYADGGEANG